MHSNLSNLFDVTMTMVIWVMLVTGVFSEPFHRQQLSQSVLRGWQPALPFPWGWIDDRFILSGFSMTIPYGAKNHSPGKVSKKRIKESGLEVGRNQVQMYCCWGLWWVFSCCLSTLTGSAMSRCTVIQTFWLYFYQVLGQVQQWQ